MRARPKKKNLKDFKKVFQKILSAQHDLPKENTNPL